MHAGRRAHLVLRWTVPALACLPALGVIAAPAAGQSRGPVSPLEAAREESAIKDPPPSRHDLPAGELRLSAAELVAAYGQELEISVALDREVGDGTLELKLPRLWVERSEVSGLAYAKLPSAGRGSSARAAARRAGRTITFAFDGARSGDSASFRLADNGIPAGTYALPYRWRDSRGRSADGTAELILYAPAREGEQPRKWSRLPAAGMEVNATDDAITESETYLTVVPGNKDRFVVGANSNAVGAGYSAWITDDGGRTFVKRNMPSAFDAPGEAPGEVGRPCCDPISAADAAGNIWYGGLSQSNGTGNPSRIIVNRIAAGTNTFQPSTVGLPVRTTGLQDKPMMSIDNSPTSPTRGRLYVVWNEPQPLPAGGIKIALSRCDTRVGGVLQAARCDDADNWSVPVSVTPASGGYIYADVGTGPDGKVYVVWWDYSAANAIRGDVCDPATTDCATTGWGTNVKTIATLDGTNGAPIPFECPIVAQPGGRASTAPGVDVDVSGGANHGRVYVTWGDLRTGSGSTRCGNDVPPQTTHLNFDGFVASAPGALPGSPNPSPAVATRLITDAEGAGTADDWFPWLAVDQTTGQAWANLYSTREDATRKTTHFYARSVTPSGGSHTLGTLTRVSGAPSDYSANPCCGFGNDYGDYTGIDATEGVALPVWSDRRGGLDGEAFTYVEGFPVLTAATPVVDDSAGGDGDGSLEPGEGVELALPLKNVGGAPATAVSGELGGDDATTVAQAASAYPSIGMGSTQANTTPFEATLSSNATCGAPRTLTLEVETDEGTFTVPFTVPTGAQTTATTTATPNAAIPDNDTTGVSSDIVLSGAGRVADLDVRVNATHAYVSDLVVKLTSPAGTTITLSSRRGGSGDNYTNTVFDDEAVVPIGSGVAPFTGAFRPEQPLSAVDGQAAAGTWRLTVSDAVDEDAGTLNSWGTTLTRATCSPPPLSGADAARSGSSPAPVRADFNGDGRGDLAVGVPSEDFGATRNAGLVQVFYGTATGLSASGNQTLSQNTGGVADTAQAGDGFGAALAAGDFNADGRDDLAVGAPGEDFDSAEDAGTVHMLLGSASGLTGTNSQQWTQDSGGIANFREAGDRFGAVLSAGDVGGTSHRDLAIGVPEEDTEALADAGTVHVLYGSGSGLTATGSQAWSQNSGGVADTVEEGDRFGAALAMGNLGNSGHVELAIGAPGEDVGAIARAGAVHVLYGASAALSATGNRLFTQNTAGPGDSAEENDRFGSALAADDFGRGAPADLAIGAPDETVGGSESAGAVRVLYGTASGVSATGSQLWTQDSSGISDAVEPGDRFGAALAAGNVGKTAESELAIGAPGESAGAVQGAGAVHVLYGAPADGLREVGSQRWTQDTTGLEENAQAGDAFGATLAVIDLGRSAERDLAVGAPGESIGAVVRAGAVHVIYGTSTALSAADDQVWNQDRTGVADAADRNDGFGAALGR